MMIKIVKQLCLIGIFLSGCSEDADRISSHCPELSNGKIIERVRDMEGTIDYRAGVVYVIDDFSVEPQNGSWLPPLAPCNLTGEFREEGLRVKFSGYILERPKDTVEDVIGQPLVITEMNRADD